MGVREERFCDFEVAAEDREQTKRFGQLCIRPVIGTCFFCGKDYCDVHHGYFSPALGLSGFAEEWARKIPVCEACTGKMAYRIPERIERRLEKLWLIIEAYIKKEKGTKKKAEPKARIQPLEDSKKMKPETILINAIFGCGYSPGREFLKDNDLHEQVDGQTLRETIYSLLDNLGDRAKKVIELRFGFVNGKSRTFKEVGAEFDVTRERIRQIEGKALRMLRHPARSRRLKAFIKAEEAKG